MTAQMAPDLLEALDLGAFGVGGGEIGGGDVAWTEDRGEESVGLFVVALDTTQQGLHGSDTPSTADTHKAE